MQREHLIIALVVLAFSLQLIALGTSYWSSNGRLVSNSGSSSGNSHFGLWSFCSGPTCQDMPPTDTLNTFPRHSFYAARAFVIITALMTVAVLAMLFVDKFKPYVYWSLIATAGVAFISLMLWSTTMLSMDMGQGTKIKFNLGYSAWLFIVSLLLLIGAAVSIKVVPEQY